MDLKTPKQKYYEIIGNKLVKNLEKRNFEAYYCDTKKNAVDKVMEIMPEGSSVTWGGSATLSETGIIEKINSSNFKVYDRSKAANVTELNEIYHMAFNTDFFLSSTNAITQDGVLVNIDGNGNRMAAIIYGPKNVIIVLGINKICTDINNAVERVHSIAAPINATRLNSNTPCAKDGLCHDCQSEECICAQIVFTRRCKIKHRIKVIIIGEELGF